jgi:hypothetical protein
MLVAVTGFGRVWRRRYEGGVSSPERFARAAFFNTTGVSVNGVIRTRPKIVGHARFNGVGGFSPNYPSRMINRVFECAEPCLWEGQNKVLFKSMLPRPVRPDLFLVVVRAEQIGHLDVGAPGWKTDDSLLISFSEYRDQQEAMLLMPANSLLSGSLAHVVLTPSAAKPWVAELRLTTYGK